MITDATTRYKRWEVRVKIGGTLYPVIGLPTRSIGLDQARSTCSVELVEMPPTRVSGQTLQVDIGCNGTWRRFFTGFVAPDTSGAAPRAKTINGVDMLYRLNRTLGTTLSLDNLTFPAAVSAILTAAGIGSSDIAGVYDPGYTVAATTPILLEASDSLSVVFQDLLRFGGASALVLPSGKIQVIDALRTPGYTGGLQYSSVETDTAYRIYTASRSIGLYEEVVSSVTASGPAVALGAAPEATYTIAGLAGRNDTFSSRFIQTVLQAEAIAEREARRRARLERTIELVTALDPDVLPGRTLLFRCAEIEYPASTPAYVVAARTSGTSMALTLSLGPSRADGYSNILPPIPDFVATLVTEYLNGTGVTELFVDGSASISLNGVDITSWTWSTATTTYSSTPNSSGAQTQPRWVFIFPVATTSASITLTVSDGIRTASITRTVSLVGDNQTAIERRVFSFAAGSAWYISTDGGATWRKETSAGDAVAVPPVGAGIDARGPLLAGATYGLLATRAASGTGLRQTTDALMTASTALASIGTAIARLWQNETTPARVWAVAGQKVYRSLDTGVTMTEWGTPLAGSNPTWVQEDPVVKNSVFVLVGKYMKHTTATKAPGTSWATLFTGPTSATAKTMVRSQSGDVTWVAFTGTFTGSPLHRVEGSISVTFPVVSPVVSEITALALADGATPLVYAIDQEGRFWRVNGLTGTVTALTATMPAAEPAYHALHDPDPDKSIIYIAGVDLHKYFPLIDTRFLFKAVTVGEQGHMIGIGGPTLNVKATLYVLPYNAAGAADKLWKWTDGTWTGIDLPAAASAYWVKVAVNPFNPQKMLLLRWRWDTGVYANALYYSDDGGATWSSPLFTDLYALNSQGVVMDWSMTDGNAWMLFYSWDDGAGTSKKIVLRGTNDSYVSSELASMYWWRPVVGGIDGEAWGADISNYRWVDGDNTITTPGATPFQLGTGDSVRLTRQGVYTGSHDPDGRTLAVTTDYRTTSFTDLQASVTGNTVACLADGTVLVGQRDHNDTPPYGIAEIADAFGTPSVTTFFTNTIYSGVVRSDRQTQTVAAAILGANNLATCYPAVRGIDGTWTVIPRPPAATGLANWIEIVGEVIA